MLLADQDRGLGGFSRELPGGSPWPVPGDPLAAWSAERASLVVYRGLPIHGGTAEGIAEALANRLTNLPGMRVELKTLHRRLQNTAIYVTHYQVEAMTMADRIVVMRAGRIEQIGGPLELYDRPATLFVAQFIGSPTMNVFRGNARPNVGGHCMEAEDGTRFSLPADVRIEEGQPIILE